MPYIIYLSADGCYLETLEEACCIIMMSMCATVVHASHGLGGERWLAHSPAMVELPALCLHFWPLAAIIMTRPRPNAVDSGPAGGGALEQVTKPSPVAGFNFPTQGKEEYANTPLHLTP
jgi:hypothetical protein